MHSKQPRASSFFPLQLQTKENRLVWFGFIEVHKKKWKKNANLNFRMLNILPSVTVASCKPFFLYNCKWLIDTLEPLIFYWLSRNFAKYYLSNLTMHDRRSGLLSLSTSAILKEFFYFWWPSKLWNRTGHFFEKWLKLMGVKPLLMMVKES